MSREQGATGAAAGGSKGGRTTPALLRRGATREERQTRNKGKGGAKGGEDLGGRGNPWQVALEHAAKQSLVFAKRPILDFPSLPAVFGAGCGIVHTSRATNGGDALVHRRGKTQLLQRAGD